MFGCWKRRQQNTQHKYHPGQKVIFAIPVTNQYHIDKFIKNLWKILLHFYLSSAALFWVG